MERLPLRTDVERWRFLLMKWTERFEIRPGALERKIRADYLDNVVRGRDLLDRVCWNLAQVFFARLLRRAVPNLLGVATLSKQ